ncbi:MAG: hypothetical protein M1819_003468 [Sarea resinae]|nr:MAG: hypothetical protein M1819_003468 [Sarea resinae]
MEDPVKEVPDVIKHLTQTPPSVQRATIETYFTPSASFTHPLCRTGSFANSTVNSRWFIWMIYRWYKIMSPRIELEVSSVAYDAQTLRLYVSLSQIFRIFIFPWFRAHVELVTVLQLTRDKPTGKYLISSQNDLYQVNEIFKFADFFVPVGQAVVFVAQVVGTLASALLALLFWPVSWAEERVLPPNKMPLG